MNGRRALAGLLATTALAGLPSAAEAQALGIDCHVPRALPDGRLVLDPGGTGRARCEADRDHALAYARVLDTVRGRIERAIRSLPPPLLFGPNGFVEHLEADPDPAAWIPAEADLALFDAVDPDDPDIGWLARTREAWGEGVLAGLAPTDPPAGPRGPDYTLADWMGDWGVRARACRTGPGNRAVQAIVWIDPASLRERWTPEAVQRAAAAWREARERRALAVENAPRVTAGDAAAPTLRDAAGNERTVEPCFGAMDDGPWATPGPKLAVEARAGWDLRRERREAACEDPAMVGSQRRERVSVRGVFMDLEGTAPLRTGGGPDGPLALDADAAWLAAPPSPLDCREPREARILRVQPCERPATVGGRPVTGHVLRSYMFRERRDPQDPARTIEWPFNGAPDGNGGLDAWPVGERGASERHAPLPGAAGTFCESGDFPPAEGPAVETGRVAQCAETHGDAYPEGDRPGWWRSVDYPPDWGVRDLHVVWGEADRCYRIEARDRTERRTRGCPSGYSGSLKERRTVTDERRIHSPESGLGTSAWAPADAGGWTTEKNSCVRRPSSGRSGGGCDSEDCRKSWQWGIDTDGDKKADLHSTRHTRDLGKSVPYQGNHLPHRPPRDRGNDGEDSGGGSGGGGCFLTTAVTRRRGEADDGPTLTALRAFRDGWLRGRQGGPALIERYYAIAPRIVAAIPDDHPDWEWIANRVDAAVKMIFKDRSEVAFLLYADMVSRLADAWLRKEAATGAPDASTPRADMARQAAPWRGRLHGPRGGPPNDENEHCRRHACRHRPRHGSPTLRRSAERDTKNPFGGLRPAGESGRLRLARLAVLPAPAGERPDAGSHGTVRWERDGHQDSRWRSLHGAGPENHFRRPRWKVPVVLAQRQVAPRHLPDEPLHLEVHRAPIPAATGSALSRGQTGIHIHRAVGLVRTALRRDVGRLHLLQDVPALLVGLEPRPPARTPSPGDLDALPGLPLGRRAWNRGQPRPDRNDLPGTGRAGSRPARPAAGPGDGRRGDRPGAQPPVSRGRRGDRPEAARPPARSPALPAAALAAAGLLAAVLAPGPAFAGEAEPAPARAWQDAVEAQLAARSGRLLEAQLPGETGQRPFVFYAPLSALWLLEDDRVHVAAAGTILRGGAQDKDAFRIVWQNGGVAEYGGPAPVLSDGAHASRHPLAEGHDRLLAARLVLPVAGLPAGSRFGADGVARLPEAASGPPGRATFWRSFGDFVVVEHADGRAVAAGLDELLAALGEDGQ